ncbi:riboflavin synthase subunit alpha [Sulfuricella sp. T08]|uniref:riboflavin synthase n=1 Tax=Sulfuricella sp. T08 TaxID=1632857 RepID=UPI0006179C5F|nr:riboflavin synthase [Sulfuricella sp. T08]GAO36973.1 riboflavin synthase subunit alpha [Sulfuricella sp. T08]
MFTGIIEAVGQIKQVEQRDQGVRLTIASDRLDFSDVAVGDSIAANGVCLTVISLAGNAYTVDVSQESLNCTVGLSEPGEVNLEKAMRLSDRLGGHLVSGHVDGVGEVVKFEPVGESHRLMIRAPRELSRFIAPKGSITVNGVSLTVNEVSDDAFSINLIPHTLDVTTLKHIQPGSRVNLEVDMLARYVDRLLHPEQY